MPTSPNTPRLSVEITPEQQKRVHSLLPWGTQRRIFTKLLDSLLDHIEKEGHAALGALLLYPLEIGIRKGKVNETIGAQEESP